MEVHTRVEREVRGELKKLRREIEEVCGITSENYMCVKFRVNIQCKNGKFAPNDEFSTLMLTHIIWMWNYMCVIKQSREVCEIYSFEP